MEAQPIIVWHRLHNFTGHCCKPSHKSKALAKLCKAA